MGWWWPSSSGDKNAQQQQQHPDQNTLAQTQQDSLPTQSLQEQTKSRSSRNELLADSEIRDFLRSLESSTPSSTPSTTKNITNTTTSPSNDTLSPSPENNTPDSIAPESLYPDTMSCRSAFDYAFFCQSLGGQWVNVYRYGELRSCSEHWENFWLCMRARGINDDPTRKEMIRNHYRKKAIKYKTGPSSEDVWEVRMEPLKGAFQGDFGAYEREVERVEREQQQQQVPAR